MEKQRVHEMVVSDEHGMSNRESVERERGQRRSGIRSSGAIRGSICNRVKE